MEPWQSRRIIPSRIRLKGFKEALRLKPSGEWARQGLLESLKARNGFYRLILQLDLWRSRLTTGQRFVLLALVLLPQTRALFLLLVLLVALTKFFFTFLLWFDPYGRLALSPKEIATNKWILAIFGSFSPGILLYLVTRQGGWIVIIPSLLGMAYCGKQLFAQTPRDEKVKFVFLLSLSIVLVLFGLAFTLPTQATTGANLLAGLAGGLAILTVLSFIFFVVGRFLYQLIRLGLNWLAKR
jgi:hypothetical protein